jgi:phage gp46-like protein
MPWDLKFDPLTNNLVRDGAGGWERAEHRETAILNQFRCHLESWWADSAIGTRFHNRDLFAGDTAALVEAEARRAFQLLEDEGIVTNVRVQAREVKPGRVDVRTAYFLVDRGQLIEFSLPLFRPGV